MLACNTENSFVERRHFIWAWIRLWKEKISIDRGGMIGDRSKKGESLLIWESSISKGRVYFDKDENLEISGEGSVSYESFTIIEV